MDHSEYEPVCQPLLRLYLYDNLKQRIPESVLDEPYHWGLSEVDVAWSQTLRHRTDQANALRRRIALYRSLQHWFASNGQPAMSPGDRLMTGELGKPFFLRSDGSTFSGFNSSARGESVAVLVGTEPDIGIDVEDTHRVLKPDSVQAVMRYFYTDAERLWVIRHDNPHHAFLELWTRKEAGVKALGLSIGSHGLALDGLSQPLALNRTQHFWSDWGSYCLGRYIWCAAMLRQRRPEFQKKAPGKPNERDNNRGLVNPPRLELFEANKLI